ncbi:MAG: arsenate reductase [Ignavibacteriae bacterium]|nr:arsenate reductase [Ignavibacteriota bacterium]
MPKLTVYQKPTCTTCRNVIHHLKEKAIEFESVNYYVESFTVESLKEICHKLQVSPRELLRTKESLYKEMRLAERTFDDDELLSLMVKHPDLIQRPIIVKGKKGILVRPIERLKEIL